MTARSPLLVPCLNCNALPGHPCTQPTSTGRAPVAWYHFARREDA